MDVKDWLNTQLGQDIWEKKYRHNNESFEDWLNRVTNGSPDLKDCIKKLSQKGIKVVLVTGRMNAAASKIAQDLGLDTPVVSYQGGLVVENGKTLYERYLTEDQTKRILDWACAEKIHINLYNNDILYSEIDCYEVQRYCNNLHTAALLPEGQICIPDVSKVYRQDQNQHLRA